MSGPNNPQADLGLWHKTTPEEMGCVADDESQGLIENEGVANTRAGVRSTIVGGDYNTSATGNTHKFTGHVKDDATGQYYAKARYFTTGLGRWSQPEPLLKGVPPDDYLYNSQKLNPYVYCDNNPTKYVDFDGNDGTIAQVAQPSLSLLPYIDKVLPYAAVAGPYIGVAIAGVVGWEIGTAINENIIQPFVQKQNEGTKTGDEANSNDKSKEKSTEYPSNPDKWKSPKDTKEEKKTKQKTDGKHR